MCVTIFLSKGKSMKIFNFLKRKKADEIKSTSESVQLSESTSENVAQKTENTSPRIASEPEDVENVKSTQPSLLIPAGGTTNWLVCCEKYNYRLNNMFDKTIESITISHDCRIVVENVYQWSKVHEYPRPTTYEPFCTTVTFYKKELDMDSIYAPHVYERPHCIYYPFGTRFDKLMLIEIAEALSGLIDKARDLPQDKEMQLKRIQSRQKALINLFRKGTNDPGVVRKIMIGSSIPYNWSKEIKVARYKKDWLPDFTGDLFWEFNDELAECRKQQSKKGKTKSNSKVAEKINEEFEEIDLF